MTAAARELSEETGYKAANIKLVCSLYPNPAIQSNRLHTFLASDCELAGQQELDPFEDIDVITPTIPEVIEMAFKGEEMTHSLIIAGLFRSLRVLGYKI